MRLGENLGYTLLLWIALLVTSNLAQNPASNSTRDDDDDDFVPYQGERFDVFDWTLFREMSRAHSGNLLISPISIKLALILLYEGAQGRTAYELAGAMNLPASRSATRDKFTTILRSLANPSCSACTLNLGTRIYIDSNVLTRQRYSAIVKAFYETDVINTNLSDTHHAAQLINNWVRNVTENHIEKMIEDEKELQKSVMLIMNAMYFKAAWRRQYFLPNNTQMGRFFTGPNSNVNVPFMYTMGRFYFSESSKLNAKIIRIPYESHKFAMYIILPYSLNGIDQLIREINPFILTRQMWLMQDLPVSVWIPKFKFDFTSHLENTLRELGVQDIFDNTATLTGIARTKRTSRRLQVSDIVQKAGIEVNEKGTTAYAATEVEIGNKIQEENFYANHPFVFYIEDESTGTVLYAGKMMNPLETVGELQSPKMMHPPRDDIAAAPNMNPIPVDPFAQTPEDRYNFFNVDLFQAVNVQTDGNVILSPASAKLALAILAEGAAGQTRQELLSALRLPAEEAIIRSVAQRTLAPLRSHVNGTEIDVASCIWIRSGLRIVNNYVNVLREYYGGDIQPLNFADSYTTANTINDWVRQATRNKIQTLIQPGGIPSETRLMLTSALYFKGQWLKSFNKQETRLRCFNVPNRGCQDTYLMESHGKYRYGYIASLDADAIVIPYSDRKTAMLVLLPSNKDNDQYVQILSKDLSYIPMSSILANLREREVLLVLPKFSIESKLDLRAPLLHVGIRDIFELTANLSGMSLDSSLRVSSIIQNAKIEVDEDGTIAAAATAVAVIPLMSSTLPVFRANRPFLFAIVDLQTNGTLFAGRLIQPDQTG